MMEFFLTLMALRRSVSCSRLLKQLLQLQLLQNSPFAKQSQYLEKRRDFFTEITTDRIFFMSKKAFLSWFIMNNLFIYVKL